MKARCLVAIVVVIALGSCENEPSSEPASGDASSRVCDEFRSATEEVGTGTFTDEEARERFKVVYDASNDAEPDLQEAAENLLQAATEVVEFGTAATYRGLGRAAKEMDSECDDAGY